MHPIFLHYPINTPGKQVDEKPFSTYTDDQFYYFVVPVTLSEEDAWEKYVIASYFHEQGMRHVVCPLLNVHNQFITSLGKEKYMVCYAKIQSVERMSKGQYLAFFHHFGYQFPYQPQMTNNYGRWKELWISKIEQYEGLFQSYYQQRPVPPFMRTLADIFPYIIGLSENAVQYLNIVEKDQYFNQYDQAVFAFGRLHNQLENKFIWIHDLIYDHAARDLAEFLRPYMLKEGGLKEPAVQGFLTDYLSSSSLSPFGWKLCYARLIFPIHIYDKIDQCIREDGGEQILLDVVEQQSNYEKNLRNFFFDIGIEQREEFSIQLDWLMR
ncbi:spore coat protein YutH [Gracilibacillus ureilyticus]|uniref:Spore coat protein YutH n=1 Tax=Gracilibacillus ureilyticus TaxID=531814 RepID=A0A1H9RZS2_9BACI|nr:hypothetical protein [Gracilibacillus ureilyticus]SER78282.1 spore coat protein YutH [Gracilibacillus ureilyticus]